MMVLPSSGGAGSAAIERHALSRVPLGDVALRGSGHTPNKKRPDYWGGHIPWVSLKDTFRLDHGLISTTTDTITASGLAHSSAVMHTKGSVVLLRDAGIGKSAILNADMAVSQHFMVWRCGPSLDNWYLYYYLQYMKPELKRIANGSTIKTIGLAYFRQLTVPLPDFKEQRLIAETVRSIDDLVEQLEILIDKKQAMRQGMLQELFTGRTRLPGFNGSWVETSLGALGIFLKGRGIKRDEVRAIGIPCIRYGELYTTFNDYTSEARSFVAPEVAATALPLQSGDLLFTGSGETRDEIGKCVAYLGRVRAVAGGDLVVLRGTGFNSVYLALLANTPAVVNQKARSGQGDAVVHISSRALASVQIHLPPLDEQDALAAVILDADQELDVLHQRLDKARDIKTGMMQQLLTGRIRLPVREVAA